MIQDHARLHSGKSPHRIDVQDCGHVLRHIEDHGDVAALSGERSSAPAAEKWSAIFASKGNGGDYVVVVAGKDYADRNLAVVGSVSGVEGASAVIETDFAANVAAEIGCQARRVHLYGFGGA